MSFGDIARKYLCIEDIQSMFLVVRTCTLEGLIFVIEQFNNTNYAFSALAVDNIRFLRVVFFLAAKMYLA